LSHYLVLNLDNIRLELSGHCVDPPVICFAGPISHPHRSALAKCPSQPSSPAQPWPELTGGKRSFNLFQHHTPFTKKVIRPWLVLAAHVHNRYLMPANDMGKELSNDATATMSGIHLWRKRQQKKQASFLKLGHGLSQMNADSSLWSNHSENPGS
jgi:hypothetical protein